MLERVVEDQAAAVTPVLGAAADADTSRGLVGRGAQREVIAQHSLPWSAVRRDVLVREQHGEHRRGHAGDRFDDLSGARALQAVGVDAGAVRVEEEDLPAVVLGEVALLRLDVLEVGELIDAGEQTVEFIPDLVRAGFDVGDPRELICVEELGTPRRRADDEAIEQGLAPGRRSHQGPASQTLVRATIGSFATAVPHGAASAAADVQIACCNAAKSDDIVARVPRVNDNGGSPSARHHN